MRNTTLRGTMLVLALGACKGGDSLAPEGASPTPAFSPARADLAQVVHVDYAKGHAATGALTVTTEASDFRLESGGIRWFSGGQVEYTLGGSQAVAGGNTAIGTSEATVDGFITTRSFVKKQSTNQTNPCTGLPNTVKWDAIDGAGGIVAVTSTCYYVGRKEIIGFSMTIDNQERWTIGGSSSTLDVENTVTHEFGHVAGLGHVGAPKDFCLTMYPYVDFGETMRRTLGLGDKLGMQKLYGSSDITAGSCGS